MSIEAITYVKNLDHPEIKGSLYTLLLIIAENTFNDSFVCRLGQPQLAKESRMDERSVRRLLKSMAEECQPALIERKPRYRYDDAGGRAKDDIIIIGFESWYGSLNPASGTALTPTGQSVRKADLPDNLSGGDTGHGSPGATGHCCPVPIEESRTSNRTSPPLPPKGHSSGGGKFYNLLTEVGQEAPHVIDHFLDRVVAALEIRHSNPRGLFAEICKALQAEHPVVLEKAAEVIIQQRSVLTAHKNATDAIATAKHLIREAGQQTPDSVTITKQDNPQQWAAWFRTVSEQPKAYPGLRRIMEIANMAAVPSEWPPAKGTSAQ